MLSRSVMAATAPFGTPYPSGVSDTNHRGCWRRRWPLLQLAPATLTHLPAAVVRHRDEHGARYGCTDYRPGLPHPGRGLRGARITIHGMAAHACSGGTGSH